MITNAHSGAIQPRSGFN